MRQDIITDMELILMQKIMGWLVWFGVVGFLSETKYLFLAF